MKIAVRAHARFPLEGDALVVATDPYSPSRSRFAPLDEPADIVPIGSATDEFHSDPRPVTGDPVG